MIVMMFCFFISRVFQCQTCSTVLNKCESFVKILVIVTIVTIMQSGMVYHCTGDDDDDLMMILNNE